MNAIDISTSALSVEWRRLEVCALNLANMNSTRDADGGLYHPLRLVSGRQTSFGTAQAARSPRPNAAGIEVVAVETQANGERRSYDPSHPNADADGFVTYPNVDHAAEMTLMLRASRAYEANLAAIDIAQQMYASAFELGRRG